MRWQPVSVVLTCAACLAGYSTAAAHAATWPVDTVVCLTLSPALDLRPSHAALILAEVDAIWQPYGVAVRQRAPGDDRCNRVVMVRADSEVLPGEASAETALAWMLFVEGNARQVIFLRTGRVRALVDAFGRSARPDGLNDYLAARLAGRSLAHELGHVLLNSRDHERSGLMRPRYRADDLLRDPPSSYTLTAAERARLATRLAAAASAPGHSP